MTQPAVDTAWVFSALGTALLALGGWRCLRDRRLGAPGSIWLTVGAVFVLMSIVLHGTRAAADPSAPQRPLPKASR